jgi:hypothetical protein
LTCSIVRASVGSIVVVGAIVDSMVVEGEAVVDTMAVIVAASSFDGEQAARSVAAVMPISTRCRCLTLEVPRFSSPVSP